MYTTEHIWCVIPVYNNGKTVKEVALGCREYLRHVVVFDDGSTDCDIKEVLSGTDIIILRSEKNSGKGESIRKANRFIEQNGGKFMITIDGDGQHYPEDILKFIPLLQEEDSFIVVGSRDFNVENVPKKSRFGREFSNFWLRLETGVSIEDSQSGFRAYPVSKLLRIRSSGKNYDFEAEILTRAIWSGLAIKTVPIKVFYPKEGDRISSFRPFLDNLIISLMHTRLVGRRLLPIPYPRLVVYRDKIEYLNFLRHPLLLLKGLLKEEATPMGLAVSAGVGVFLGVLPLLSVHTLVIIYVTTRLHLNKIMALTIQNLCMPPFVPIACIEVGHYMLYREWFTDISWQSTFGSIPDIIWKWFLGSLVLAPIMALLAGIIVFFFALFLQKKETSKDKCTRYQ